MHFRLLSPWRLIRTQHPPVVATSLYFDDYYENRDNLLVPPNILDPMVNSAYSHANQRHALYQQRRDTTNNSSSLPPLDYPYNDPDRIAGLTAAYYALVEEVDTWVGRLLDRLQTDSSNRPYDVKSNTLVVFTSDHGDLLGSHGMTGKGVLLEEASRVPLLLYYPGKIQGGLVLKQPASHLDIFATLLDYADASAWDWSDGTSLRRWIEGTSFNEEFDEETVVVELNGQRPMSATVLSGIWGGRPSFMIRKDQYKLILPRRRDSTVLDMMYNLDVDPYETFNLLGVKGANASDAIVGKAEYLKALLVEWMLRHDGPNRYYSDNKYQLYQGQGDVQEVRDRRTWKAVPLWISHDVLPIGRPVRQSADGWSFRNEYIYLGRTAVGGETKVRLDVSGFGASYFALDVKSAVLRQNDTVRVKVTFASPQDVPLSLLHVAIRVFIQTGRVKSQILIPIISAAANDEAFQWATDQITPASDPHRETVSAPLAKDRLRSVRGQALYHWWQFLAGAIVLVVLIIAWAQFRKTRLQGRVSPKVLDKGEVLCSIDGGKAITNDA